jgi:N-6 DNA Methylase
MKSFEPYIQVLESLASEYLSSATINNQARLKIENVLNGQPSKVIRELVPISELRASGVFFTNRSLADQLVNLIVSDIKQGVNVYDPACGVGDLLLACARHFPISEDLTTTLKDWNKRLGGGDLYSAFIRATKVRLLLLAIERGSLPHTQPPLLEHLFSQIQVRDALAQEEIIPQKICIVINPPYTMVQAPKTCTWASGLVSHAALFLEKYVYSASPGTKIVAILPDVLRTGSRYIRWRAHIEKCAKIEKIELLGCFDTLTDVNTFVCQLTVGSFLVEKGMSWWVSKAKDDQPVKTVGEYFEVRVGPVVPHRHPLDGPVYPYIHAHQLPSWKSIEPTSEVRNFSGTIFVPPFVAVRRTSRPGDKYRAIGTIILGEQPVAVENHLIVLKPKSSELDDCLKLLEVLRCVQTNDWLDERIRCRHLTVTALRDLPWWIENEF